MKKLKLCVFVLVTSLALLFCSIPPLRAQIELLTFNMGTYWLDTSIIPTFSWQAVNNYLGGFPGAIPGNKLENYGTSNWYLQWILEYSSLTFQEIYKSQALLTPMTSLSNALLASDDSDASAKLQGDVATYNNQVISNINSQIADSNQTFVKDIFSQNGRAANPTPNNLPFANQLTYTTLFGVPYFPYNSVAGDPKTDAKLYVENASGAIIPHAVPSSSFSGSTIDQDNYARYYRTITAVQTFNTYLLSDLYYDSQNKTPLTALQEKLILDASDSQNWFAQVASEKMGIVFRQMLLFTSQIYVLMVQTIHLQKEMLAAQAMTNTLLIMGNQFTEVNLLRNAKGTTGTPH